MYFLSHLETCRDTPKFMRGNQNLFSFKNQWLISDFALFENFNHKNQNGVYFISWNHHFQSKYTCKMLEMLEYGGGLDFSIILCMNNFL